MKTEDLRAYAADKRARLIERAAAGMELAATKHVIRELALTLPEVEGGEWLLQLICELSPDLFNALAAAPGLTPYDVRRARPLVRRLESELHAALAAFAVPPDANEGRDI